MGQSIRVLIINDRQLFAVPIAALFSTQEDVVLVGSATELQELRERLRSLSVDVMLIDVHAEMSKSIDLIRGLKADNPDLKIIALGVDHSDQSILNLLEAGVDSYTFTGDRFDDLVRRIKELHNGRTCCSPRIVSLVFSRISELAEEQSRRTWHQETQLTPRERDILHLVSLGLRNKEIAQQLKISLFTVKNHVHHILEKLQVKCRREAIQRANESGLFKQAKPYPLLPESMSSQTG